jgi:NarL family two-component system response regulator LiaR
MSPTPPIRVLIADDHAVVRHGLRAFLTSHSDIDVIGEAGTGSESVRLVEQLRPNVVVIDLLMPEGDGFEAIEKIHTNNPATQVVVLTSHTLEGQVLRALRAGALSYLPKETEPDEIVNAIRRAARGEAVVPPTLDAKVVRRLASRPYEQASGVGQLTDRELDVLRLIAEGLSNAAIAERLFITEGTVKTHVTHILSKLEVGDRTSAAARAWREGIVERSE